MKKDRRGVEWPTLALIVLCTGLWFAGVTVLSELWGPLGFLITVLAIALHSSLSHEVLHGHPFATRWVNEALVAIQPNLAVPFGRFRDLHLAHHQDANLTDPYDDPESNYLDPTHWQRLSGWVKGLYRFNNTLLGRMLVGTALGQMCFLRDEWRTIRAGNRAALRSWGAHLVGVGVVVWFVATHGAMALWLYLVAAYVGLSLIRIRTFLEHQAHEHARGRTVIIEDRGPLAWLFLNNNFHVVHHMHPRVAWYDLPALYARNKAHYLRVNEGYRYGSYAEIFAQYFWRAKDPVPHPGWSKE